MAGEDAARQLPVLAGVAGPDPSTSAGSKGAAPRTAAGALRPWLLPLGLLVLWQVTTAAGFVPGNLVPSPGAVLAELWDLARDGDLTEHLAVTAWRVAAGFLAGTLAATALGAICGYWRPVRSVLDPTLQALKAVPSLAWVPLFILWFGIFEASKVTLIAVGVFFPVYLNLISGIRSVDRKLIEVGRVYGLGRFQLITRILLPATLPSYIAGLRGGLALGWMFVIAAELMGASSGLGYLMIDGQMTGNPAIIVGSLILFAIVGKLSDALLAGLGNRLLAWQDTIDGQPDGDGHACA